MRQKNSPWEYPAIHHVLNKAKASNGFLIKIATLKTFFFAFLGMLLISSCASKKDIYYLQSQEGIQGAVEFQVPKIQVNDILNIRVTAENMEAVSIFNTSNVSGGGAMNAEILKITGYLVSETGEINFPTLGTIKVIDKTVKDLEQYIAEVIKSKKYIENSVVVTARVINSKVTISGEVKSPGTYNFTEQVLTLPQALGYAGDLTINGKRNNILVVREENGERTYAYIDLTKSDFFKSPYYYIKQNDWIYVQPNAPKVASSGFIGNVGTVLGLGSFVLTITLLLTR